jgi:hypothetical protein
MASYSNTNTIIVWSENKELKKYVNEIAKSIGIHIHAAKNVTDLFAVPCFLKIVDAIHLKEIHIWLDNQPELFFDNYLDKILYYSKSRYSESRILVQIIEEIPFNISKKYLTEIIEKYNEIAIRWEEVKIKQFKSRAFRVVYLHHIIKTETYLCIADLIRVLNLSERNIRRDIETLKIIYPKLDIGFDKDGHRFGMRRMGSRAVSIAKVPNVKEKQLHDKIKRIIFLYDILKKGNSINVEKNCAKFDITERTLSRDIKVLRDLDLHRTIIYSKDRGYHL